MHQIADLIGKPFVDGGRGPDGYDCWGLASEVYRRFGKELPDYKICCEDAPRINQEMETQRPAWLKIEAPTIPCLVVMKMGVAFINHVGVYIGEGKFMHTRDKIGANIARIDDPNWRKRIEGYYKPGW